MEGSGERKKLVEVFIDTDSESESYTSSERSRASADPRAEEVLEVGMASEEEEGEGKRVGGLECEESDTDEEDMVPLPHAKQDGEC